MNNYLLIFLTAAVSFFVTAVLGFALIPWLLKYKIGQKIHEDGPETHKVKEGTPTMGGIMFIVATAVALAVGLFTSKLMGLNIVTGDFLAAELMQTTFWSGVFMAFAFALVGFMDDFIIILKKRNKGLNIKQKTILQLVIIFAYLASLYLGMKGKPYMFVPFVGNVEMGPFFWVFGAIVMYATTNSVNFTDGVDGLCASVTLTTALALLVIALMRSMFGVGMLAAVLAGGCAGFLVWNKNPAKVFMGDTGSLFLGGMVLALVYCLNTPLILLPVGLIYVIEGASDVIQIFSYKVFGRRVFKMAPIHHHFEKSGWTEKKVVKVFTLVNILGGLTAIAIMHYGQIA
ncbi:MAG: phospho-N-acetylmuramoyl-pentapeptide-transferase [Clostridiales bacterium]|nr:phospho-N-acetylmuramoyl-pentapeptide-transferase [Clostridiales bacterium]